MVMLVCGYKDPLSLINEDRFASMIESVATIGLLKTIAVSPKT